MEVEPSAWQKDQLSGRAQRIQISNTIRCSRNAGKIERMRVTKNTQRNDKILCACLCNLSRRASDSHGPSKQMNVLMLTSELSPIGRNRDDPTEAARCMFSNLLQDRSGGSTIAVALILRYLPMYRERLPFVAPRAGTRALFPTRLSMLWMRR